MRNGGEASSPQSGRTERAGLPSCKQVLLRCKHVSWKVGILNIRAKSGRMPAVCGSHATLPATCVAASGIRPCGNRTLPISPSASMVSLNNICLPDRLMRPNPTTRSPRRTARLAEAPRRPNRSATVARAVPSILGGRWPDARTFEAATCIWDRRSWVSGRMFTRVADMRSTKDDADWTISRGDQHQQDAL